MSETAHTPDRPAAPAGSSASLSPAAEAVRPGSPTGTSGTASATPADPDRTPAAAPMRLLGLDLARSLALFGMIVTHVWPLEDPEPTWAAIFAGRSSALFAVLAGFSVVLAARAPLRIPGWQGWLAANSGLWVRGAVIFVLGLALGFAGDQVAIILANYGLMFIIASVLLRIPTWVFGLAAPAWMILSPLASHALRSELWLQPTFIVPDLTMLLSPAWLGQELVLTGYYPVLQWIGYLMLGMFLAGLPWRRRGLCAGAALIGAAVALFAKFVSSLLLTMGGRAALEAEVNAGGTTVTNLDSLLATGANGVTPPGSWWWMAIAAPHAATPLDMLHASGCAVAVIGACMWVARGKATFWLTPLIAAGAMPLTIYTAHVCLLPFTTDTLSSPAELALHVGLALVCASLWRRFVSPRGPLEAPLSGLVRIVRHRIVPAA